ncbi:MAG: hypothetical protein WCD42_14380 [Rhizomicrobium sp.]
MRRAQSYNSSTASTKRRPSDTDLGRPIEVVTDMSKSRALGFTGYQTTDLAFFDLFTQLRHDRLIP